MEITDKLSIEQQNKILEPIFGLKYENINEDLPELDEHYILFTQDGDEFYGIKKNEAFDFSTLAGIFSYASYTWKNIGYFDAQHQIRKVLGL